MSDEANNPASPVWRKVGNKGAAKPHGQFLAYPIDVRLERETVWLTSFRRPKKTTACTCKTSTTTRKTSPSTSSSSFLASSSNYAELSLS